MNTARLLSSSQLCNVLVSHTLPLIMPCLHWMLTPSQDTEFETDVGTDMGTDMEESGFTEVRMTPPCVSVVIMYHYICRGMTASLMFTLFVWQLLHTCVTCSFNICISVIMSRLQRNLTSMIISYRLPQVET